MSKLSRASFLKSAGIATGAVVAAGVPGVAEAALENQPQIVISPSPLPREVIVAYVRNADKGEVTIVSGLHETTFKDHGLVKKITKAAAKHPTAKTAKQKGLVI